MLGVTTIYVLPDNIHANIPAIVVRGEDGVVRYGSHVQIDGSCEIVQMHVAPGESPSSPHVTLRTHANVVIKE